jgi:hypothetical protein
MYLSEMQPHDETLKRTKSGTFEDKPEKSHVGYYWQDENMKDESLHHE